MGDLTPWTSAPSSIRWIQKNLGLTEKEFASLLGVNVKTIKRWKMGHSRPRPRDHEFLLQLPRLTNFWSNETADHLRRIIRHLMNEHGPDTVHAYILLRVKAPDLLTPRCRRCKRRSRLS